MAQVLTVEIALIIMFGFLSGGTAFFSDTNVRNMILTAAQVVLLGVAQAILMSAGQIDISQGAVVILSSVFGGKVMIAMSGSAPEAVAITVGLLVCVVTGITVGLINGFLVGRMGINSLVATLGMLSVASGVAAVVTKGTNIFGLPSGLQSGFGFAQIAGIPAPTLLMAVVVGVIWYFYRRTSWGTHVLAVGSNRLAASRVGIPTARKIAGVFVLSAFVCGISGFIDLARYSTTDISGHTNDAMASIAGALIGGTSLTGGGISFVGTIAGSLLAIILQSGLVIINLSPFYQTIAVGVLLIIAVSLDKLRRR
ncbi:hypothetical protein Y717_15735 [Streptomyces scopuliridis RB72]|uniref:Autoinducer 2 import system permease protein LsrC n=1 Tax=Streptomyces scopuliridis RB72 TaxID=1440053 RepID=A0A2T7T9A9_9ACTN|nr:hypothetical protein Y717_15735 [Streptomyces scopuliridis RB72]